MKIIYEGKEFEVESPINGFALAKIVDPEKKNKALAFRQEGHLYDMNNEVKEGEVSFVLPSDPDGFEMMNHSCSHLMAQALMHLYPGLGH